MNKTTQMKCLCISLNLVLSLLIFGCGGGGGGQDVDAADLSDPGHEKFDNLPQDEGAGEDIVTDDYSDFQEGDIFLDEGIPEEEELPELVETEELQELAEAESKSVEETAESKSVEETVEIAVEVEESEEEYAEYEEEYSEEVEETSCEPYPECLFEKLCRPCKFDEECEIASGGGKPLCVIYGEIGRFCGVPCKDASGCPEGYECKSAQSHLSQGLQCVRKGSDCPCTDEFKMFLTFCYKENGFGKCYAEKSCDMECPAQEPAFEACNGADDNCNGLMDEGYGDFDMDGAADCVDVDIDDDGDPNETDCDNFNKDINNSSAEICNKFDDNCNGLTDEPNSSDCKTYYYDEDNDGYGKGVYKCLCAPTGYYRAEIKGDCNDKDPKVNPQQEEDCTTAYDDDCDSESNIQDAKNCKLFYYDADNDGFYSDGAGFECWCEPKGIYRALFGGDCNDGDYLINPSVKEDCQTAQDDNCNGNTNEMDANFCKIFYYDGDNDGFGKNMSECWCSEHEFFTADKSGDCDDGKFNVNPSKQENCSTVYDDDCNSKTNEKNAIACSDFYFDEDGDGYGTNQKECWCSESGIYRASAAGDCNDIDFDVNPGVIEDCGTLYDDNCNGVFNEKNSIGCSDFFYDFDGDGYYSDGASKECWCSAVGLFRSKSLGDCNDNDSNVKPGAVENCSTSYDDNCNSLLDEKNAVNCKNYYYDGDSDGYYASGATTECWCNPHGIFSSDKGGDCDDAVGDVNPSEVENCLTTYDDNCNDVFNEKNALNCSLYYYDFDNDGYGTDSSECLCDKSGFFRTKLSGDCNDGSAAINPGAKENCNTGYDDNCNQHINEKDATGCSIFFYDNDGDGYYPDGAASQCWCSAYDLFRALQGGDCNDNNISIKPDAVEDCGTSYDDNCNDKTNEKDAAGCYPFYFDNDGDTFYASGAETQCWCDPYEKFTGVSPGDCNDGNSAQNPSAGENCSTNYDDDCNSQTNEQNAVNCLMFYYDGDSDNYGTNAGQCWCAAHGNFKATANGDCDDSDPEVHPGASICNKDADCDGKYSDPAEACDDANSTRWDGCHQCSIEEFVVNTTLPNNQENPSMVALSNGDFLIVWESWAQDGSASGIFGQMYNADGSKKGIEFQVNTYTSNSQINARVAALSGGGFVVVWNSYGQDGSQESVHGQIYNADGSKKGGEFQINTYFTNSQAYPDVAALANGRFVVVWQSYGQDGSSWGVYGQRYNSDGTKDGTEFQINTFTSSEQSRPSVASFGDSSFVVVWQSYGADSSEYAIAGQLFDSSGAKSENEFIVNTTSANDQKFPSVASESSGKFTVVWQSYSAATGFDILGQRFNAGGVKAGSEFTANTFTFSDQENPHISMFGDGSFNIFWTSWWQDGNGEGIYGQRYNADGTKKGDEFKVNIYTYDSQRAARSTLFPDGKFGVVWSSTGQFDGTNYDILCQRYSSDGTKIYK